MSDLKQAEALDAFVDAYRATKSATPPTPEAELAADLIELASSVRFDARLPSEAGVPLSSLPSVEPDEVKEYKPMIAQRRMDSIWSVPLTLVATLLFFVVVGALLIPFTKLPTLAPPVQETRLPLPVGGRLDNPDPAVLARMQSAGMTWLSFAPDYRRADRDALVEQARALIDEAHRQGFRVLLNYSGAPMSLPGIRHSLLTPTSWGRWRRWGRTRFRGRAESVVDMGQRADRPGELCRFRCRQAYEAIAEAASDETMVISAALAPTNGQSSLGSDQMWNDDLFYTGMAEAGAADYADCIGASYYEGTVDPTLSEGDARGDTATRYFVPMLQRAADPFRSQPTSLCLTESSATCRPRGLGESRCRTSLRAKTRQSLSRRRKWWRPGSRRRRGCPACASR
ncbi:MAG: hypothetical protein U0703_20985 [Anaerolineae bacterium]